MSAPTAEALFAVLDATWPAASYHAQEPWILREGAGGGQRVSAATAIGPVDDGAIDLAEREMRRFGQRPLFMVRDGDQALDGLLEARGYEVVDPVVMYLARVAELATPLPLTAAMPSWPPLAIQRELWAAGGIGPARLAVMDRSVAPKTAMLGRSGDDPSGTAFFAVSDGIGMVHALEVTPERRQHGVGRAIMQGCANWAADRGADWLALAVTRANAAANGLYQALGMQVATRYHYRRAPEAAA